jgi:hypothetical protein
MKSMAQLNLRRNSVAQNRFTGTASLNRFSGPSAMQEGTRDVISPMTSAWVAGCNFRRFGTLRRACFLGFLVPRLCENFHE